MHEMSIVESFLNVAVEHGKKAGAEKIVRINLVIGDMTGVVRESVEFYFNFLSRNTLASEAEIGFTEAKTRLRCRECETLFYPDRGNYRCPVCDTPNVDIIAGKELYVESIEIQ